MRGNLLFCLDSFQINDWSEFPKMIIGLNKVILKAKKENKDIFFRNNEFLQLQITENLKFFNLTYSRAGEDEALKRNLFQLYDESFHEIIGLIRFILDASSPAVAVNLEEFEIEKENENNGLSGICFIDGIDSDKCVWNDESWYNFHFNYYKNNPSSTYFFENQRIQCKKERLEFNPLFPNIHHTNKCYEERWDLFYKKDKSKEEIEKNEKLFDRHKENFPWNLFYGAGKSEEQNEGYRKVFGTDEKGEALFRKIATFIANRNFYWYDADLSKYNDENNPSKGKTTPYQIFVTGEGRNRKYLSTDFTLGGFEVCDYGGKHEGEYFFNGKFNQNSIDSSGGHDIVLP